MINKKDTKTWDDVKPGDIIMLEGSDDKSESTAIVLGVEKQKKNLTKFRWLVAGKISAISFPANSIIPPRFAIYQLRS